MDNPESSEPLLIGKEIPWKEIEGEFCRVKHFTPFCEIEAGKIKRTPGAPAYAGLSIESPKLPQEAYVYIVNKVDFRNLWEAFEIRGISSEEELLIVYEPFLRKRFMSSLLASLPRFHVFVCPKGHLEEIYSPNFLLDKRFKSIAEWHPK